MIFLQQYLSGLIFFGLIGLLFGCIREFRELKRANRNAKFTRAEWSSTLRSGAAVFKRMFFWWTTMYAIVLLAVYSLE